jgi:3-mercaptopyruvate sulfurtransferase SseA
VQLFGGFEFAFPWQEEVPMRWKQFLTPVKSMNSKQVREFMQQHPAEDVTIIDVRQPEEYQQEHLPGSKLIPLPELPQRITEIDPDKPAIVY